MLKRAYILVGGDHRMLTDSEIRRKLKNDPNWEPEEDVSDEEWILFEEIRDEIDAEMNKEGKKVEKEESATVESNYDEEDWTFGDNEDDDDLDDDDDDDDDFDDFDDFDDNDY